MNNSDFPQHWSAQMAYDAQVASEAAAEAMAGAIGAAKMAAVMKANATISAAMAVGAGGTEIMAAIAAMIA